jgi:hypothetical protein
MAKRSSLARSRGSIGLNSRPFVAVPFVSIRGCVTGLW